MRRLSIAAVSALSVLITVLAAPRAAAQCSPQWLPGDGIPGVLGIAYAATMWDPDGPGPLPERLVVGGSFEFAGRAQASNIAMWDGSEWHALGSGMDLPVLALAVLPTGELIAAGQFSTAGGSPARRIARWNGTAWSPLGAGIGTATFDGVNALTVLPSGELIAGGAFSGAGGNPATNIARWDGLSWSPLGSGLNGPVQALALPRGVLTAGGSFSSGGGLYVAQWNGSSWSSVGGGTPEVVNALGVLSNGDLVAGGNANEEGIGFVWRWNGAAWSTLDGVPESGPFGSVRSLTVLPGGDVVVGGGFGGMFVPGFGTVPAANVARWNGSSWSALGLGTNGTVEMVASLPGGEVLAGGQFFFAGATPAQRIARWDGFNWSPLGSGVDFSVKAVAALPGNDLVVGGEFFSAGTVRVDRIARRRNGVWEPMGTGMNGTVRAIVVMPGGDIVAGGDFTVAGSSPAKNIARWDGFTWSPLGSGIGTGFVGTRVHAIVVLTNGDLVVGGDFTTAGGIEAENVARWDGVAWHPMGQDLGPFRGPGLDDAVWALALLPNGEVIAGGDFGNNPGLSPRFIARFDGSNWQSMGSGTDSTVYALAAMPNGDLIAGGEFTSPGAHIARWNGSTWSPLGAGVGGGGGFPTVHAIRPVGADVYAAGDFTTAGGAPANRIARWDGSAWSPLGSGLVGTQSFGAALGLAVQTDGALVAVGGFMTAGNAVSAQVATWGCGPCYANCDGSSTPPLLNVNDFVCFQSSFAAGNPYADCNHDTLLNVNDFICFQGQFAAGCR